MNIFSKETFLKFFNSFPQISFIRRNLNKLNKTSRRVSVGLAILAILFGVITFAMLSGFSVFGIRPKYLIGILCIDIAIFLAFGVLISKKVV